MNSRGRGDTFTDPNRLNEMLSLRMLGVPTTQLGGHYGVDHSTIIYHCKLHGVSVPQGVKHIPLSSVVSSGVVLVQVQEVVKISQTKIVVRGPTIAVMTDETGERINPGRNYAEYIAERKRREEQAFWDKVNKKQP